MPKPNKQSAKKTSKKRDKKPNTGRAVKQSAADSKVTEKQTKAPAESDAPQLTENLSQPTLAEKLAAAHNLARQGGAQATATDSLHANPNTAQNMSAGPNVLGTDEAADLGGTVADSEVSTTILSSDQRLRTTAPSREQASVADGSQQSTNPSSAADDQKEPVLPRRPRRRRKLLIVVLIVLLALAAAGYFYYKTVQAKPTQAQIDTSLVAEVARKVALPDNETPTITTIVDEQKIDQDFLKDARAGDKVLLYFKAGRAVVYRPSTQQVVTMGPLSQPVPRVFLRQGTKTAVPASVSAALQDSGAYTVVSQDSSPLNTGRNSYKNTVVVDLAGNRPDIAENVARLLDADVVELPAGESRPEGDILVIVGADAK